MSIIIGADFVPTRSNKDLFINGEVNQLFGDELINELSKADFRIFNLEVPLTDMENPIVKYGDNLLAPKSTIRTYKAIGVDILTLANNHILDQGEQGLESTCRLLEETGIAYLGVGKTPDEAAKPYMLKCDGKNIGIYACVEHEFSIVSDMSCGANPYDPLESFDHVVELKKMCDYVIVLYHGGKEHYRYPSPNLQKTCHKFVEKGADLIICQHTHCIGCEEKYKDGTIVYGQGNFLFDGDSSDYWQTSLLIKIDDEFNLSYIPLIKNENTVRLADKEKADEILSEFNKRSEEIRQDSFVEKKYSEFAESMLINYLISLSGIGSNFLFRVLNKLSGHRYAKWFVKRRYSKKKLLAISNIIECEAHRELLIEGLKFQK